MFHTYTLKTVLTQKCSSLQIKLTYVEHFHLNSSPKYKLGTIAGARDYEKSHFVSEEFPVGNLWRKVIKHLLEVFKPPRLLALSPPSLDLNLHIFPEPHL